MEQHAPGPDAGLRVGTRVVIRHRLDTPDRHSGATLTDVVGDLVALDETSLVVLTRRGEVTVARAGVTATRVIPPRPSRRGAPHRALSVEDLQRVMVGAWPAMETERLGQWLLRASRGFTQRANSVMTAGDPGMPLAEAVEVVQGWYAARALPANLTLAGPVGFDPMEDPLGVELARREYTARVPTHTLTAPTRLIALQPRQWPPEGAQGVAGGQSVEGRGGPVVEVGDVLSEAWLTAYRSYRDADDIAVRAVLTRSPRQVFATVREPDGRVVGISRLGLADGWGGIAAMWVSPQRRGTGLGTRMLLGLARAAQERGASSLHLQTDSDNIAALSFYERRGFERHHSYVNLTR
ncbi:MAG: GNAT family N-acetyltransferase [Ornithinibacter sp.]